MTKRTCNIIKACKNWQGYDEVTQLDRVKKYMSDECCVPVENYTDNIMDSIMFEAMCDYIDTCDKPSAFLHEMNNLVYREKYSRAEQIAVAFELVQVCENFQYINGFREELWDN